MKYDIINTSIQNTNGLALATEIYKPHGSGVFPVVLIFHGFTGYKEENNLVDIAHKLAMHGIVTVRFTASGFGDSEGSIATDYRFGTYRTDAESVFAYIQKLDYVDKASIGVCGHSMGGKLAILFCADHPDVRAMCAISAPIHLLSTAYAEKLDDWKRLGYFEKVSGRDGKSIRIPYAYIDEAEDVRHDILRAAKRVENIHALVIAGAVDQTVAWESTKEIFDTLNCPKEWLLVDGMDHWYKKNVELLSTVHEPIVNFFEKFLHSRPLKG